jgi:prepilin-type N-terminal cleavage/methylation domain-containing protein
MKDWNIKLKFGFTLAEVLISLLIIGVVASIVIPGLINNTRDKEISTAISKARANLYQATLMIKSENAGTLAGVDFGTELSKKLKTVSNCNVTGKTNCWHASNVVRIKNKPGEANTFTYTLGATTEAFITTDGSFYRIPDGIIACDIPDNPAGGTSCYKDYKYSDGYCGSYYVDINGAKGPNIRGKDVRYFRLWSNGKIFFDTDTQPSYYTNSRNYDTYTVSDYQQGGQCYDPVDYTLTRYE